jgi:hypothetical protein
MARFPHPTVLTSMQYMVSASFAAAVEGGPRLHARTAATFLPTAVLFYTSVLSSKFILQVGLSVTQRALSVTQRALSVTPASS